MSERLDLLAMEAANQKQKRLTEANQELQNTIAEEKKRLVARFREELDRALDPLISVELPLCTYDIRGVVGHRNAVAKFVYAGVCWEISHDRESEKWSIGRSGAYRTVEPQDFERELLEAIGDALKNQKERMHG